MADFYFWIAGTPIQKSIQGLFRSLLFGIFLQCPEMISRACPSRWASDIPRDTPWDLSELMQLFKRVISDISRSMSNRFCFFIDGLDEFNGDVDELLGIIKEISSSPNIKLCLSSRPWNVFEDALGKNDESKLYLEDLTRNDIQRFVFAKLEHLLMDSYPDDTIGKSRNLLYEIVDKAQGVFLWVYLVVRSLKERISNADSLQTLERRISAFPSDLYDFFLHMLKSVNEVYRRHSATILRVALDNVNPLPFYLYSFLMEDDPDFAITVPDKKIKPEEGEKKVKLTKKRLFARCQGLLEIHKPNYMKPIGRENELPQSLKNKFGFLHRTVRDFLYTKSTWQLLEEILGQHFHSSKPLCCAHLAAYKTHICHRLKPTSRKILTLASEAELVSGTFDTAMLDELCILQTRQPHNWSYESYQFHFLCSLIHHGLQNISYIGWKKTVTVLAIMERDC